jgi:hypothetical protein
MSEPARGGRPAIGPAISVAYPQELLTEVDRAANRQKIARAEWLRRAAERALPYRNFDQMDSIAPVLAELGGWLDETHEEALDPEATRNEREFRAAGYDACLAVVRDTLRQALDTIDRHAANEAHKQAKAANPAETAERGVVWGRAMGAELAAGLLQGLLLALPTNGENVKFRAALNDPNEDLD